MKNNLPYVFNGILAIAVAILYTLHFAPTTPVEGSDTAQEPTIITENSEHIAYVNFDSLLNNFSYYKKIKADAEAKRGRFEKDITAKKMAFQEEILAYQQTATGMTELQRQSKEQQLGKKQQDLAAYEQKQTELILKSEEKITEDLYKKISTYLKEYSKKKGLKVVLAYSKGNGILYANEQLDITKDVLKGLNE